MQKNIYIFLLLFFFIHLLCADINEYKYDLVKEIGTGSGKKELLGYVEGMPPSGPTCFAIYDNKIYINDNKNNRLAIFDNNFHFEREIKVDKYLFAGVDEMVIDPDDNIYLDVVGNDNITKMTPDGKILFEISRVIEMSHEHLYFIDKYAFYYDNKKKIGCINNKGELFGQEKALEILEKQEGWMEGFFTNTPHEDKFKTFLNSNNLIYINSKLYIRDIITFEQYISIIKTNFKGTKFIKDIHNQNMAGIRIIKFNGFDNENNYYFEGRYKQGNRNYLLLLIYSKYGQLLDCFYNPIGIGYKIIANGDILFMSSDKESVRFLKIAAASRWRFASTETLDPPTPKALTITATSFVDWKNTYTPAKAFDNNLTTGWLEAAEGPGKGESVTLTL
ncbi:MAG: hypothetical protein JXB88_27400, partial [Spirochaetales bacterium]|nr:hypothetical protein [Spirochaetales bacterium]